MAEQPQGLSVFRVEADGVGQRLDVFLTSQAGGASRAKLQKLIAQGKVQVNAAEASARRLVALGDEVTVQWAEPPPSLLTPVAMALDVLFEDDELIVLNKPAGISVHPGAGDQGPTLVQGLLYHCGRLGQAAKRDGETVVWQRPGIVHRLDKDTTGALVCAKTDRAHAALSQQFHDKTTLVREYSALLDGRMAEAELRRASYLYRDPQRRLRFASLSEQGFRELQIKAESQGKAVAKGYRYALSHFRREAVYGQRLTLATIRLFTGRTHQIRVHAGDLGLQVVGDQLYHRPVQLPLSFPAALRTQLAAVARQLLHARTLRFKHPVSLHEIAIEAPYPDDFAVVLAQLEAYKAIP